MDPFLITSTRRATSIACALLLPLLARPQAGGPAVELVNPFIGTGGHGHTFPGACVPNGLVQLSPDTRADGVMDWDGCGGYHYSDSVILGFSHTHLSGTGVADLCDVLLMPMTDPDLPATDPAARRSRFSHTREDAHAGYYRVHLDDPGVEAELTATARVGMHRYTFPSGRPARMVLDLRHRDALKGFSILKVDDHEVVGERRSSSWARDQRLFFCIRFSAPIQGEDAIPSALNGQVAGFDLGLLTSPLVVKVGISAVSVEGARANLEAEVPGWDFDAVRQQAEAAWNTRLGKVQVTGGSREEQRIFHTALYHCYIAPCIFNDVDGRYRGMDGQVHQADHPVYTIFSLWDTFRALHPLMTLLEPELTRDVVRTFLLQYEQGGRLPVWELWGNETDCMIGYHSVSVIADAYLKGIRGFDADKALAAMVASAMAADPVLEAYRRQGYISSEDGSESVSKTLEYAYDDWCIARMAEALGRKDLTRTFDERAGNWRNLYDTGSGFFRARRNGGFVKPFDPYEVNFHYTEANAWQYSLFYPHTGYLVQPASFLDSLFTTHSKTTGRQQADITGLIGQYAHGNEPSHHMAYLYSLVPDHARTRALVKRILQEQYRDAPDGLSGNEDCGQMSAWYVMSAIGLYQVCPGDPVYTTGHPLFREASISLADGARFTLAVSDSSWQATKNRERTRLRMAISALPPGSTELERMQGELAALMERNSHLLHHPWVSHASLMQGGTLHFDVDRVPEARPLLRAARTAPATTDPVLGAPVIDAPATAFSEPMEVTVRAGAGWRAYLNEDGRERERPVNTPFTITSSCTVIARAKGKADVSARYTRMDGTRKIVLGSPYAGQYAAGGERALIDGLRGGSDYRTGEWQGFEGRDLLVSIDLGTVKDLERAGLSVLQDQRSWIWYPLDVTIAWSMNGEEWSSTRVVNTVDRQAEGGMKQELWSEPIGKRARYVKVIARNAGPCPDWHPGKGGTSWIFADEVLIDVR
jgi:predicted alpha-1,2-mannosidase